MTGYFCHVAIHSASAADHGREIIFYQRPIRYIM